ncbi:MAG: hypothetical protein DPW09_02720 [Anaerolineae bacterium]|nr:hypothetical protein [Anaerolineales bacterium]MCQ3972342.1 hypothetical protein [Anaerolineae bacterium]
MKPAGTFDRAVALKGQVTGPITLIFQLFAGEQSLITHQDLANTLGRYSTSLALWQANHLRRNQGTVLMFVDEPCLGFLKPNLAPATRAYLLRVLKELLVGLRVAGVVTGLHCCAYPSLAILNEVQPDIFSFDAFEGLEAFCASPEAKLFLEHGGQVAFGLIPTSRNLSAFHPEMQFYRWTLAAEPLPDLGELARRSLVTATCGLGLLDEPAARTSFQATHHLSRFFKLAVPDLLYHHI